MVWISNEIWNPEAQPIEIHTNAGQKCLDFEWSSFQMVGTIAISMAKAQSFWKPDHLKSNLQKVRISNVSRFQMVGFQNPSVKRFLVGPLFFFRCSGNSWSTIDEPHPESPLSQVSVGENVVWAVGRDRKVWFRNGIHGAGAGESDSLAKGTKWIEMVGQLQMISKLRSKL